MRSVFFILLLLLSFCHVAKSDKPDLATQLDGAKDLVIGATALAEEAVTLRDQAAGLNVSGIVVGDAASNVANSALLIFNQTEHLWVQYSNNTGVGLLLAIGLLMLLFGYRLLRVMFFLAGFWFGFAVIFVFTTSYTQLEYKYCLLCSASIGLMTGTIALFILKVGLFLMGAFLGFWIATFILSIPTKELLLSPLRKTLLQGLPHEWQYYIIVGSCCVVFGLLMLTNRIQKFFVIFTTSLGGAFSICCFIDFWVKTGFSLAAVTILKLAARGQDVKTVRVKSEVIALLIGCVAICFFGMCFQYWNTAPKKPPRKTKKATETEMTPV